MRSQRPGQDLLGWVVGVAQRSQSRYLRKAVRERSAQLAELVRAYVSNLADVLLGVQGHRVTEILPVFVRGGGR